MSKRHFANDFSNFSIADLKNYVIENDGSLYDITEKEDLIKRAIEISQEIEEECSICQLPIVEKISLTCPAAHSFCFKCILDYIEKHQELKSCPNCRNGLKFITLGHVDDEETDPETDPYYTIKYFKECLPILYKIKKQESYLISEYMLLLYLANKKQLELMKNKPENFDLIKWITPKFKKPSYQQPNQPNQPFYQPPNMSFDEGLNEFTFDIPESVMNAVMGSPATSGPSNFLPAMASFLTGSLHRQPIQQQQHP